MELEKTKTSLKTRIVDLLMKIGPLLALIILSLVLTIASDKFFRYGNFMNILKQASINSLISAGMLTVLITAGIDLSVGSNCVLASCVMGVLVQAGVTNIFVLITAALITGFAVGYLNGILLTKLDLPHPFVSTMGMKNITLGIALLITNATPIGFQGAGVDGLLWLGSATIGGFPVSFIFVIIIFVFFHIFLSKMDLGRQIYCIGGNAEAARLSGINTARALRIAYTISGVMAAIAGIVLVGRVSSANAMAGTTYDSDAIAACIIGGASFNGGKGTIWGTLVGSLLIAVIRNGLNLLGAKNDLQYIVIGVVIIFAVTIDIFREKAELKARKMATELSRS